VERANADAGREARGDLRDFLFDRADHFHRVHAGAHDDDAADDFAAVDVECAAAESTAHLDCGDILHVNGGAVDFFENDFFEIGDVLNEADAAHDEFHAVFFENFSANVQVALLDGHDRVLEGNAGGAHFGGGELDLILADESADAGDFGDARDGVELVAHEPI